MLNSSQLFPSTFSHQSTIYWNNSMLTLCYTGLHLPLVLVPHPGLLDGTGTALPAHHHSQPSHESLLALHSLPPHQPRGDQHHRPQVQDGRLVSFLHARSERRLHHLQRGIYQYIAVSMHISVQLIRKSQGCLTVILKLLR